MNFRITTNMMMGTYQHNLMNTTNKMNTASERVQTGRKFSSYAEDPTSATTAWTLRRNLWRNENQITNTEFSMNKIQVAWTAAGTVVDSYGLDAKEAIVKALNDPTASGRETLGIMLQETADSMVNALNAKYGDHFVFAGNDCMEVPFAWNTSTGNLEYRGVNINASPGTADYYKLMEMTGTNETNYVDIGLGLTETAGANGTVMPSTAFDNTMSGIDFVGWGSDEDGDSLCLVSLVKELGDIFANCDPDSGAYANDGDSVTATRLLTKFEAALSSSIGSYVELDTKQKFLSNNLTVLEDSRDNMNVHITSLEDVDPAEAIMEMSYQQYCYSAALKIGTQILSQSLLDYM